MVGHTQTRLQPGLVLYAAGCSLDNWERTKHGPIVPSGHCYGMRGGASLCNPLENLGGFGEAPVIGVSGVATTGRIWAESRKIPPVIGGI